MDSGYPPEAWQRLGRELERRRGELGYGFRRRKQFLADRKGPGPPSEKMLARIENAERTYYPPSTIATLERLYGYEPGSFEAVLQGREPTPASPTPAERAAEATAPDAAARIFPDDEAAQQLLRRALRLGSAAELADWVEYRRERTVTGFPEDRRDDAANGARG